MSFVIYEYFLKEITHFRHFFENNVNNFHNTHTKKQEHKMFFSETLIISYTKSWVSQNNIKYKSEFEWTVLNGMTSANHIQAAATWLATAALPTKWYPPPGSEFLSQLRIPSLQNQMSPKRGWVQPSGVALQGFSTWPTRWLSHFKIPMLKVGYFL